MKIEVNTLDYAMGEVLYNKIHDKEMLAVIRGLENQRHLLEGVMYKFEIWTNHKNLEYFMKVQKLNRRQAYQTLCLSRFDFTL